MDLEGCVSQALAQLSESQQQDFASDPHGLLTRQLGLTIRAVEQLGRSRAEGGACDGVSFLEDGVILYAPTQNSRRENFTLAHELGHWLVDKAPGIYDWLADQDAPGKLLETVCDRVAGRLLLREDLVTQQVGTGPVKAQHLMELYSASQASRPVCAIALAARLFGLGAVVIVDRSERAVTHASVNPDPERGWPTVYPWPGQRLIDSHPLLQLRPGFTSTRRQTWRMPWNTEADYYIDASADAKRVIAVFSASDLWGAERFHPKDDRDFDRRPVLRGSCCGKTFERRGYPCPSCNTAFCPDCGNCRCERDAMIEVRCQRCFLQYQPHLVVAGLCVECRS